MLKRISATNLFFSHSHCCSYFSKVIYLQQINCLQSKKGFVVQGDVPFTTNPITIIECMYYSVKYVLNTRGT